MIFWKQATAALGFQQLEVAKAHQKRLEHCLRELPLKKNRIGECARNGVADVLNEGHRGRRVAQRYLPFQAKLGELGREIEGLRHRSVLSSGLLAAGELQ